MSVKLTDSILQLAVALIRTPSRAGRDDPAAVLGVLAEWFKNRSLPGSILTDAAGKACAFYAEYGAPDAPLYILDACIDTADTGEGAGWSDDPFSGVIRDGWLYGRGSGDSKMGVSIFSHLFSTFVRKADSGSALKGRMGVLFDADEHTGMFGGIKRLLAGERAVEGVCIGYPGMDEVVIGARGFYRAAIVVPGTAAHTGMPVWAGYRPDNAARRGAELAVELYNRWNAFTSELPDDSDFPFGPGFTLTEIHGGSAFSVVPDRCELKVDIRLTHRCDAETARRFLAEAIAGYGEVEIEEIESWPAYTLAGKHPLVTGLSWAIAEVVGRELPKIYCGPSNIGNLLASYGIPATCGFGVLCENFHAVDERIRIDTIETVYAVYECALRKFFTAGT